MARVKSTSATLSHTHVETEYFHVIYMINFFDQKLWDVDCLVRRALNNEFWQEVFKDL